jgi:hypothetical protein
MLNRNEWDAACSRFEGFRANVPRNIKEETVQQYNEIVTDLESASGIALEKFRIPAAKIQPRVASFRRASYSGRPGSVNYSKDKYCDSDYFQSQVDALSQYLKRLDLQLENDRQKPPATTDKNRERTSLSTGSDRSQLDARSRPLRVFLCHSSGDKPEVRNLYTRLSADGFAAWLDEEDLLPGQDWAEVIPKVVRRSDVVIVCLSKGSVTKEGYVQKEIKYAIDVEEEKPEGTIFIVPVKLEVVDIPERLKKWQCANLFQNGGYEKLVSALKSRAAALGIVAPADSTARANQEPGTPSNSSDAVSFDYRVAGEPGGEFLLYPQTERARRWGGPPFMAPGHSIAFPSSKEVLQYIRGVQREGFTVEGLEVFNQRSEAAAASADWVSQQLARQREATMREAVFAGKQLEMLERFRTNAPASWEAIAEGFNIVVRQCREAGKQLVVTASPTRIQICSEGRSLEALVSLEFDPTNGRIRYICPVPAGQPGVPRLGEFQIRANGTILGQRIPNGPVGEFTPGNLVQFLLEPILFSK